MSMLSIKNSLNIVKLNDSSNELQLLKRLHDKIPNAKIPNVPKYPMPLYPIYSL